MKSQLFSEKQQKLEDKPTMITEQLLNTEYVVSICTCRKKHLEQQGRKAGRNETEGAIHSTKIPTGPTGKIGPPFKVDPFFPNFSGWTEPIH